MSRILVGLFFAAHGLIHLGYLTPAPPDPKYPFSLERSWLFTSLGVDPQAARTFGVALAVLVVIGYALAALSAAGLIVPHTWWQVLAIGSSAGSLLLLALFWHTWLVLGVLIDVALLVALLVFHWQPFAAA